MDWKGYDSTIPAFLIRDAFTILEGMLDFKTLDILGRKHHLSDEKAERFRNLFHWLKNYFIHTKIMLPDATCYKKHHGIPSGSLFTSLIGSIINLIVTKYLLRI